MQTTALSAPVRSSSIGHAEQGAAGTHGLAHGSESHGARMPPAHGLGLRSSQESVGMQSGPKGRPAWQDTAERPRHGPERAESLSYNAAECSARSDSDWRIQARSPSWVPKAAEATLHGRPYATEQSAQVCARSFTSARFSFTLKCSLAYCMAVCSDVAQAHIPIICVPLFCSIFQHIE